MRDIRVYGMDTMDLWRDADVYLRDDEQEMEMELQLRSLERLTRNALEAIIRDEHGTARALAAGTIIAREEFRI